MTGTAATARHEPQPILRIGQNSRQENDIIHFMNVKGDACGLSRGCIVPESLPERSMQSPPPIDISILTEKAQDRLEVMRSRIRSMGIQSINEMPKSLQKALGNRLLRSKVMAVQLSTGSADQTPYFFYGSAVFPDLLAKVIGGQDAMELASRMTPAYLTGAIRVAVRGKPYPAVLKSTRPGDIVHGMLVFGLREGQKTRIQDFEGPSFTPETDLITFELADGQIATVMARIFVWNAGTDKLVCRQDMEWRTEDLLEDEWFQKATGDG